MIWSSRIFYCLNNLVIFQKKINFCFALINSESLIDTVPHKMLNYLQETTTSLAKYDCSSTCLLVSFYLLLACLSSAIIAKMGMESPNFYETPHLNKWGFRETRPSLLTNGREPFQPTTQNTKQHLANMPRWG